MTQEASFLHDILENPDDDATRLIFADWLDDNGQPERAEFIRLQIEDAPLPIADRPKERQKRESALLKKFLKRWFAPPKGWKPGASFTIRRGFPWSLSRSVEAILECGEDLFSRWPITRLQPYHLSGAPDAVRKLAGFPWLTRLRELSTVSQHPGPAVVGALLDSPHLGNLVRLNVASNKLGDEGVIHLARLPHLAGVQDLDIRHNGITSAALEALIASPYRRAMTSLCLCG